MVCLVAALMYKYVIASFILAMDAVCFVNLQAGEAFGILMFAKLGNMLRRHTWGDTKIPGIVKIFFF